MYKKKSLPPANVKKNVCFWGLGPQIPHVITPACLLLQICRIHF